MNGPIATALRAVRDAERLSHASLAELLGVSSKTLSRWELGSVPNEHQRHGIFHLIADEYPAHRERLAQSLGIALPEEAPASPSTAVLSAALDGALFQATEILGAPPAKVREAVALVLDRVALLGMDAKTAARLVAGKSKK